MWLFKLIMPIMCIAAERISSTQVNLAKSEKVMISPGLVSVIEFPQNIIEVRVGNLKSVKAIISQNSPKELTVYLSSSASIPTNIIVRAEKRIFVFDIVPSRTNHQDYIKVKGAFGAPSFITTDNTNSKTIETVKLEHMTKHILDPQFSKKLKVLESKRLDL